MNLRTSFRGAALAVGGLLIMAGVVLANGGVADDTANASASAEATPGGAVLSATLTPEPSTSAEPSPSASPEASASATAEPTTSATADPSASATAIRAERERRAESDGRRGGQQQFRSRQR